MKNIIGLEILEDGTAMLNKDVKKDDVVVYQNEYLRKMNKTVNAKVHKDLSKGSKLKAGYYEEGEIVITAEENTEDYLVVKLCK